MNDTEKKIERLADLVDDLIYFLWLDDKLSEDDRTTLMRKMDKILYAGG